MDIEGGQGVFVVKVLAHNQIQRRQSGGAVACCELTFHTAKGGLVLLGLTQLCIKPALSVESHLPSDLFLFLFFGVHFWHRMFVFKPVEVFTCESVD